MKKLCPGLLGGVVFVFLLSMSVPAAAGERPAAVSPGSGSGTVISGACPTFSWGAVAGAESYELVAYQVPKGFQAEGDLNDLTELWRVTLPGSVRSWTPPIDQCFAHGGRYAWAVRAKTARGDGVWSEASLFSIEAAPSAEEVRGTIAGLERYLADRESRSPEAGAPGEAGSPGATKATAATKGQGGRSRAPKGAAEVGPARGRKLASRVPPLLALPSRSNLAPKTSMTPVLGTPSLSIDGNLSLGAASNLFKDGRVLLWNDTAFNTALGDSALASLSGDASYNTAVGYAALQAATGGSDPAFGSNNTATGAEALYSNTTGYENMASGRAALFSNKTGYDNTATGYQALVLNTTGFQNMASGADALNFNTTGLRNTASGADALGSNASGDKNTASGAEALFSNKTGSSNIGIGYQAGLSAPSSADDNIFIGNLGAAADTTTIKIGTEGTQTRTFIAGIRGKTTGTADAVSVVIDSSGQLGTVSSSLRFKQDVESMGDVSDKLYELRPVSFRYKQYVREAVKEGKDPNALPRSYGLIAEEVAKVFPDLVVDGKDGQPETIKYRLLAPMLLNELQKEHRKVEAQTGRLTTEKEQLVALQREVAVLRSEGTEERQKEATREAALEDQLSRLEALVAALQSSR